MKSFKEGLLLSNVSIAKRLCRTGEEGDCWAVVLWGGRERGREAYRVRDEDMRDCNKKGI